MNKLKGSSNAIRMKHIVAIFILSMVAALPLRVYQLLVMVNPENGFFENSNFAVPALYIIAFVFAALMVVLSFFSKGIPAPKITEGKNFVLGVVSLVLSVGFVLDVINIMQTITPQTAYGFNSYASQSLVAAFIKENGGVFLIVQLVSAVLSALYFLIFGVSYFEGKATYKKIPLLSLAPVLWGMSILISKLMKPVSFITVSELLFEIFALVFIMIFFLTFARVSTGVFTENGMWSVFGCGFAAALFGGIITIPRLVAAFVGLAPVTGHPFSITHFCVEIFIVVALFSLLGFGFKTGAKNLESFSDFSFEDEENIVIKSSSTSENTENVEKSQDSAVVEAVSDDEINSAMEKLFDKGSIAEIVDEVAEEETEEIVDEVTEEETEVIVDEVAEEETEVIVDEVTEEETEEIVDEATEEETEEIVDEATEEETEEIVDEVTEEETEVIVDEVAEEETEEIVDDVVEEEEEVDEFLSLADMVISDEDEDDDDYQDDTAVEEAVVDDAVEASIPSEEAEELSVSEEPVSEAEVKAKNEKPEKKKLFKKNKKQNASQEEEIKLVSLAELRKKNSDNE